jgi:hypothetical protein
MSSTTSMSSIVCCVKTTWVRSPCELNSALGPCAFYLILTNTGSLREGIIEYLAREKYKNKRKPSNALNIRLYQTVNICDWVIDQQGGIVHRIFIKFDGILQNIRWETSKRLLVGSLVCLTPDNFKTCYFAIVFDRDGKHLRNGILLVQFVDWKALIQNEKELFAKTFIMCETTAFFEAYRYTLESLKHFGESNFPFKDHIVYAVNDSINHPKYLQRHMTYDFRPLLVNHHDIGKCVIRPEFVVFNKWLKMDVEVPEVLIKEYIFKTRDFSSVPVFETNAWPTETLIGFDTSQYEALKLALKNELVVIQGPPGTGKMNFFVALFLFKKFSFFR